MDILSRVDILSRGMDILSNLLIEVRMDILSTIE